MKIRYGFVSNSSSSSFVIKTKTLSAVQIEEILGKPSSDEDPYDCWSEWQLRQDEHEIYGYTYMDNFSFNEKFKKMGIDHLVKWEDY
jgi:hypothetical protein